MSTGIKWGRVDLPATPIDNIVIVASGPSVNDINTDLLKQFKNSYIITVNGAGKHLPFAHAWFTLDPWGLTGAQLPPETLNCKLFAAVPDDYGTPSARSPQHRHVPKSKITYLHRLQSHNYTNISSDTAYKIGLSEDRSCINTGNSGYGALNLAYHMRPKNIYLLGIDGNSGYFYTKKERNRPLTYIQQLFASAEPQLIKSNISVYNVSPSSLIKTYKKITPEEFHTIIKK
jgi:hypothetical protein